MPTSNRSFFDSPVESGARRPHHPRGSSERRGAPWPGALLLVTASLVSVLLAGCSGSAQFRSTAPANEAERTAAVDALLSRWQDDDAPGAMAMVIHHGRVVFERGYGLADVANRRPIDPDTVFRLASVSKQFTAMAILMLAEEGSLDLEDPVVDLLPELTHFGRGLRIRHLLHHTGAVPEVYDEIEDRFAGHALGEGRAPPSNWAALRVLTEHEGLDALPGTRFVYCNVCYDILALVVERASGRSFADFLEERIFEPLGMEHAFVFDGRTPVSDETAISYSLRRGRLVQDEDHLLNAIVGSGGVFASGSDLFRWDQALYTAGLVSDATLDAMFRPGALADGSLLEYGYGWAIDDFRGFERQSHTGGWLGFRTYIARYPEEELTIILLSNRADFERWSLGEELAKIYLANAGNP